MVKSNSADIEQVIREWLNNKSLALREESINDLVHRVSCLSDCGRFIDEENLRRVLFASFIMRELYYHLDHLEDLNKSIYKVICKSRDKQTEDLVIR